MKVIAKSISSGSLRGARGNSGVILSQLCRGFCKVIRDVEEIDKETLLLGRPSALPLKIRSGPVRRNPQLPPVLRPAAFPGFLPELPLLTYGALSNMKIDNMRLEHQEKLFKEEQVKNAAKDFHEWSFRRFPYLLQHRLPGL